jgi:DNA-binding MarR family transcriptional regulator
MRAQVPSERALQHATELARLIGRTRRLIRGRVVRALSAEAQSFHEWQVVANVKWQGPMTQGALAEHIGISAASLSRLVDKIEKKGLVERVGQASDKRRIAVHLTAKGEAWYAKWHLVPMGEMHAVMSQLSRGEQGRLQALLEKLVGDR